MTAEITTGIPDTAFTCEQTQMETHCMRVSKMSRTWMSCHEEGLGTWETLDWERVRLKRDKMVMYNYL